MNRDDLNRCAAIAALLGLGGALAFAGPISARTAACFGFASLWGAANFWLLGRIFLDFFGADARRGQALCWILLKPPVFFGGAAALVMSPVFSLLPFLFGFHVIVAVAIGHLALKSRATPAQDRA